MVVGISVIVPTVARPSLTACLESILSQTTPLDEVVVVFDGSDLDMGPTVERLQAADCDWQVARIANLGAYGHGARNYALDNIVTRPRVWSIDDDDVLLPGAFDTIRREVAKVPPAVHIFGCRWGGGHPAHGTVLPRGRGLVYGEIATPMILSPVCTARWGMSYDGDYRYALELQKVFGDFVWHPDQVIAEVRPVADGVLA